MEDAQKTLLFEKTPIPAAVAKLSHPHGVQFSGHGTLQPGGYLFRGNAQQSQWKMPAVTLAAPVLLAFNAVNNLFGVGSIQHDEPGPGAEGL